jgi:hypothetical protein
MDVWCVCVCVCVCARSKMGAREKKITLLPLPLCKEYLHMKCFNHYM